MLKQSEVDESMASARTTQGRTDDPGTLRDEWLRRLSVLTNLVKGWAEELDWSTRQISKLMNDSRLVTYEAPPLIMQQGTTRVLLDPISRFVPGAEGIVDLYLMPDYDNIASLYFVKGAWRLQLTSWVDLSVMGIHPPSGRRSGNRPRPRRWRGQVRPSPGRRRLQVEAEDSRVKCVEQLIEAVTALGCGQIANVGADVDHVPRAGAVRCGKKFGRERNFRARRQN
jgi:hypothetical protein